MRQILEVTLEPCQVPVGRLQNIWRNLEVGLYLDICDIIRQILELTLQRVQMCNVENIEGIGKYQTVT